MRTRRPAAPLTLTAGLVSVLSALLAGCATEAEPEATTSAPPPRPSSSVTSLVLPFDAYNFSVAEHHEIANARDTLTRACMKTKGLTWKVVDRPTSLPRTTHRRRYGVIETAVAARYGYHVPPQLQDPTGVQALQAQRDADLTREERDAALKGTSGCERQAWKKLTDTGPDNGPDNGPDHSRTEPSLDKLNELSAAVFKNGQRTPRTRAALREWSRCMEKAAGHRYADPFAAIGDPRWKIGKAGTAASPAEIRIATADVACKEKTGLIPVWRKEEARLQAAAIKKNSGYFNALREAKDQQLAAARAENGKS